MQIIVGGGSIKHVINTVDFNHAWILFFFEAQVAKILHVFVADCVLYVYIIIHVENV